MHGVSVNVLGGGSYALVMCGSADRATTAMKEMKGKYGRVNRAGMTAEERIEEEKRDEERKREEMMTNW